MKLFTVGCSFTEGAGLEKQSFECYTTRLAEKLNIEYFNFGSVGQSNDYIFRKVFELINSNTITKNDILIIQWTHYLRKELPYVEDDKIWYHSLPNSFHAYQDKVIVQQSNELSVQGEYINQKIDKIQSAIQLKNKKVLEDYTLKFINTDYQLNTTKNYINSLYAYLEYFGYKHIHFFGWNGCVIESVYENKSNFINKTFAEFTKTHTGKSSECVEHPDKRAHEKWSKYLYEKIEEFKYLNDFESQLIHYRKQLYRLHTQIAQYMKDTFDNIISEKEKSLNIEIDKIINQKKLELTKDIERKTIELDVLKETITAELLKQKEKLKSIRKNTPKTLI